MTAAADDFDVCEASIAAQQAALRAGQTCCVAIVRRHLDRIAAYDDAGPQLRAMLRLNPGVLADAQRLDRQARSDPGSLGPLHGVVVVLKDNIDMRGLPTSGGTLALAEAMPMQDAFVTARLRAAGALIIGKANLHELALGGMTVSALGGQTRNPYALDRTPGGSSGGTGVAVAAGFATVGVGTDTGQSIRSPASALGLVGLRPTQGLVSRSGVLPTSVTQDTVGPLARTADDAARLLDVLAGVDPRDPSTSRYRWPAKWNRGEPARTDALVGVRIGVVRDLFGNAARHAEVNRVVASAGTLMTALGATLVDVEIPALDRLVVDQATAAFEMAEAFDRYAGGLRGQDAHWTLARLLADGRLHPSVIETIELAVRRPAVANPDRLAAIHERREQLRQAVTRTLAAHSLDALLYPHQRVLVASVGEPAQPERNGVLSNATGMPAVCFPAGYSEPGEQAPAGVPIGVELLAADAAEGRLLAYAQAFGRAASPRALPAATPRLN